MTVNTKKVFTNADYSALNEIANDLGLDRLYPDQSIRLAQEFYEKGFYPPETNLEPKEAFLLNKIMASVTPENFPWLLTVYLNDRLDAQLPESDLTISFDGKSWLYREELMEHLTKPDRELKIKTHVERS